MFYKVIKNNKVVDVLDHLTYLKWQEKNKIMLLSDEGEAQAILGSDGNTIWHVEGFYDLPVSGYETVKLIDVDEYEYKQLKMLNCRSVQDILDEYTLLLIEEGVI
jgi:hypothetical protein